MGANWCWTFSSPSVFMLYHRTPGEARDETDWIQTCVQSYQALSGGHGRGADHTFCAEYHFERAQLLDAQIQNTIAYQEARDAKQYSIMLSSRFLAMRMALFYGDWEKIEDWIETSRKLVFEHNQYLLIDTVDISAAYIFALIGRTEQIAPWLLSDAIDPSTLLRPAYPIYDVYFNQILLARGDSINVIARHASCLRQCEAFHYAEGILLLHIQHAAAQLAVNRPWRAAEALRSALSMAAPDGILMPFVESYRFIAPILDQLYEEGAYYQEIDYIRYLARKFTKSVQRILWNHWNEHERYGLSEREFQIARFAAQRKTNAEIAGELHIAEGTVRNHLSVIFDKLHITGNTKNKRHQLEDLLS